MYTEFTHPTFTASRIPLALENSQNWKKFFQSGDFKILPKSQDILVSQGKGYQKIITIFTLKVYLDKGEKPFYQKECIPVGCVPSTAVAICWEGVCPEGGVSAQEGVCWGVCVYPSMHWGRHPPVNRMTDRQV